MSEDTYNAESFRFHGWRNRETWAVSLHLSNDEGLYLSTLEHAAAGHENADRFAAEHPDVVVHPHRHVGEAIREFVETLRDELTDGGSGYENAMVPAGLLSMFSDIGSLWRVDWDEIGANWMEDLPGYLGAPGRTGSAVRNG